jgi:cell shape-determining protein MreC
MRKERSLSILSLCVILLLIIIIPAAISEKLRFAVLALMHPIYTTATTSQNSENFSSTNNALNEQIKRLELENKLLYANFIQLQGLIENEQHITVPTQAIVARVIFRSPSSWYSTLWINIGEEDNHHLKNNFLGKNSPVLVGNSIIGVIDYFGKKQSRVRLITDSGLNPSVRALRQENDITYYLAKGEIKGSGSPLFRSNGNVLYGCGFNYDFDDDKGPARDLRTGEPTDSKVKFSTLPLLKVGDTLITTGMDGVFPADLNVALITKIYPLKEGDYYYELEAEPTSGKLDDVTVVFVLPPIGFDFNDQPPLIGR